MINYDAISFTQGIVDLVYWDQMFKSRTEIMDTSFAGFVLWIYMIIYSVTCPTNYSDVGSFWYYPLMTTFCQ